MQRITRRRFLGSVGAAVVVAGGGVAWLRSRGYTLPHGVTTDLRVLRPWQYVVVAAVGARIIAPASAPVAAFVDGYLVDLAAADRRDLLRLLAYVEHVAPLTVGRLSRFTELDAERQDRVLSSLEASSVGLLRAGFGALKALSLMAHYRRDETWPELGYRGPVVVWDKP